jgi:3-polyprenyl-4-hydroxybenzoate decarboxylase
MEVTAIHHRGDPIVLGSPPMKPPKFHLDLPLRAAGIWGNLEAAGVTDITGVWQHVSQLMTVVALRQRDDGHARGSTNFQNCRRCRTRTRAPSGPSGARRLELGAESGPR